MSFPALALPASTSAPPSRPASGPGSPERKRKKRKRNAAGGAAARAAAADDDVDASEDELVGADERRAGRGRRVGDEDEDEDEDEEGDDREGGGDEDEAGRGAGAAGARAAAHGESGVDLAEEARRRKWETMALRGQLDAEQGRRFDAFMATVIPRPVVRRINKELYDQQVTGVMQSLLGGIAKVFIADLVETAKQIQAESGSPAGALSPHHFQLARQRLEAAGLLGGPGDRAAPSGLRPHKRLLRR